VVGNTPKHYIDDEAHGRTNQCESQTVVQSHTTHRTVQDSYDGGSHVEGNTPTSRQKQDCPTAVGGVAA
jgi:hypothetical protein